MRHPRQTSQLHQPRHIRDNRQCPPVPAPNLDVYLTIMVLGGDRVNTGWALVSVWTVDTTELLPVSVGHFLMVPESCAGCHVVSNIERYFGAVSESNTAVGVLVNGRWSWVPRAVRRAVSLLSAGGDWVQAHDGREEKCNPHPLIFRSGVLSRAVIFGVHGAPFF